MGDQTVQGSRLAGVGGNRFFRYWKVRCEDGPMRSPKAKSAVCTAVVAMACIAIDYNRVTGTPPNDPTRPRGQKKGGSIWLHMDHGSGTSACVSLPKSAMRHLLRTLDPKQHPVVVMGDRARLGA